MWSPGEKKYWLSVFFFIYIMNYEHLFDPFVIEKVWLPFKRWNRTHVLLFITNFHVPIIVSFNRRTTHQPPPPKQCKSRPHLDLRCPLHTSLHAFNVLHLNHGYRRAPSTLWRVGEKEGGAKLFYFLRQKIISNWIFRKAKNVKLPRVL